MLGSKGGGGTRPNQHGAEVLSGYRADLDSAKGREVGKTRCQSDLFELCCA